ncbi:MAG: ATP-binding protein [Henriciella sp.]|nr:ATP-binding protein [Henriciella sp.]
MTRSDRLVDDPELLRRRTEITVETPAEQPDPFFGQDRAQSAVELAAKMQARGYNLFVAAPKDLPVRALLKQHLETATAMKRPAADYAYVYNFKFPYAPKLLTLPSGKAPAVAEAFDELIRDLKDAIPAAFEKPEFQSRRRAMENAFKEQQEAAFETLGQQAHDRDVGIIRGPMGFSLAPMQDDELMKPEDLKALDEAEQEARKAAVSEIQKKLEDVVRSVPKWERELRENLRKLERETIEAAITQSIDATEADLCEIPAACEHLRTVKEDLIQNADLFSPMMSSQGDGLAAAVSGLDQSNPFERYQINVFVTREDTDQHVPIVEEDNPTLGHLVGRVEHRAEGGYLTTSFKLIKPGALHLADGGFLILDARSLLSEPMSWRALKRTLQSGDIKIENLTEALSLTSTITLEPEPIPLTARIILIGDAWIYHILSTYDPDFSRYFKLFADFEESIPRSQDNECLLAHTYQQLAQSNDLSEIDTDGLNYLIEEASREAGDSQRLSVKSDKVLETLMEAQQYAAAAEGQAITRAEIERAQKQKIHRASRVRDRMQEQLLRGISLVETTGQEVGQINGLSVYQIAGYAFGKPSRITARTRPGSGQIVDIEREARLGGPIHSKGVMVLSGYLAGRYALTTPLSLHASIVLEQSYGGVEGDSASLGELLTILSALSGCPVKQSLAITGAVNQLGEVQAVGGVNEKVEGFFDLCSERGLSGEQGVILPSSNVQHLMLRPDVVSACQAGKFSVYAISTLDEAIPILFDLPAETVHKRIEATLEGYAKAIRGSLPQRPDSKIDQISEAPFSLPDEGPSEPPPDTPPEQPPKSDVGSRKL